MSFNVEKLDIDVDSIIECVDEPQMDTKMQIANDRQPSHAPRLQSHTSQMKDEIERWKALLQKQPVGKLSSKCFTNDASIADHLTSEQKFFIDARADGTKFLEESADFRQKFLFFTQTLQAVAENMREDKSRKLDKIHVEYADVHRTMTYEPYISKSPTQ